MKSWVLIIFLFSESIFYGTFSLLGLTHYSGDRSYTMFLVFILTLVGISIFFTIIEKSRSGGLSIKQNDVFLIILVSILFISLLIGFVLFPQGNFMFQMISYFIAFTVPAVILMVLTEKKTIKDAFERFRYINIYLTVCFSMSFIRSSADAGVFHDVGGSTHLLIGYTMSALFAFNILRYVYSERLLERLFFLSLMTLNLSLIVYSGSRGSLVSVLLIVLITVLSLSRYKKRIVPLLLLVSVFSVVIRWVFTNDKFTVATERILNALNLNEDQSNSIRVMFYRASVESFKESPLIGNGVGSFSDQYGSYMYPHNIIFEIMNDFGLMGLAITLIIFGVVLYKILLSFRRAGFTEQMISLIFVNVLVQLMFSGSYLIHVQFWMTFSLVIKMSFKEVSAINGLKQ